MIVATATATAMLNLYGDVQSKLQKEFRSYGAKYRAGGKGWPNFIGGCFASCECRYRWTWYSCPVWLRCGALLLPASQWVVAGTDFSQARKLNSWWRVSAWPEAAKQALIGAHAQSATGSKPLISHFRGGQFTSFQRNFADWGG